MWKWQTALILPPTSRKELWRTQTPAFHGQISQCFPWTGLTVGIQVILRSQELPWKTPESPRATHKSLHPGVSLPLHPKEFSVFRSVSPLLSVTLHIHQSENVMLCPAFLFVRSHARQTEGQRRQLRKGSQGSTKCDRRSSQCFFTSRENTSGEREHT